MSYFIADELRARTQKIKTAQAHFSVTAERLIENILEKEKIRVPISPIPAETTSKPVQVFDIFLSHSSLDQDLVLGIYDDLTARGYRVYLDKYCDPQLDRTKVNRTTARILRYRMAQSKCLFIATTTNTSQSMWVPWEMGFQDGWNGKVAILPIMERNQTVFSGQEYFSLYPNVEKIPTSNLSYPNDLMLVENGSFKALWGKWVDDPRTI